MTGQRSRLVDEAAAVAGEAHPLRHRVQVSERVDAVSAGHATVSRRFRVAWRPESKQDFTSHRNLHILWK
jgi:hypothetical protein